MCTRCTTISTAAHPPAEAHGGPQRIRRYCLAHARPRAAPQDLRYGTAKNRQELTARYKKLQLKTVLPQLEKGLSALVYTQLTDVEDEVNGLFTYDRAAVKPDANAVRSVNAALAAEFARVTNPAKK